MRITGSRVAWRAALVVVACLSAQALFSEPPEPVKVPAFPPADDLLAQVDYYIERLDQALADPEKFDAARQNRAWKDANTLAALALVLSYYDPPQPEQAMMPAIVRGAQALVAAEDRAAAAQQALAAIKTARAGEAGAAEAVGWEKVASLPALMKQVPLVHASLKRGVQPNRLQRMAKETRGQSATLAAIAQAALLDEAYAATPDEAAAWSKYCAEMRDAAGEVNSAIEAGDQSRVDAGMQRMLESCEACHARFRRQ